MPQALSVAVACGRNITKTAAHARMTACVLSKRLEQLEALLCDLTGVAHLPPLAERERVLAAVAVSNIEALAHVGHTLRFLAVGFNDHAFRRRDAAVNVYRDRILQH